MQISNWFIWSFLFIIVTGGSVSLFVVFLDMKEHKKMLNAIRKEVKQEQQKMSLKLFLERKKNQ